MQPKLVFHLCVSPCLSLAACSEDAPRPSPPEVSTTVVAEGTLPIEGGEARPYYDLRFGDVVIRRFGRPRRSSEGAGSIMITTDNDPRFNDGDPEILKYVSISIWNRRNGTPRVIERRLPDYDVLTRDLQPEPSLYDAPPTMTVFRDPRFEIERTIVRLDGTTFFGRQAYVQCRGRSPSSKGQLCDFFAWISDESYVVEVFSDGIRPAEKWPAIIEGLEAGLGRMIVLQN